MFRSSDEWLINDCACENVQLMLLLYPILKKTCSLDTGRSLSNSVINLGIQDQYAEALSQLGFEFEVLAEQVLLMFNLIIWYFQACFCKLIS